eukprot:TRINITY_DN4234_c0_g1_i2.p1 TRINITY_DN4234_c0_g1~~TRINITY_DN4234_c0_g1_i2.p1  ORF type:complete len:1257 (-),score=408.02 TRINITY_DN4234_c0_g1_i2:170-3940(-)
MKSDGETTNGNSTIPQPQKKPKIKKHIHSKKQKSSTLKATESKKRSPSTTAEVFNSAPFTLANDGNLSHRLTRDSAPPAHFGSLRGGGKLFGEIIKQGWLQRRKSDNGWSQKAAKKRDWRDCWCILRMGIFTIHSSKQNAEQPKLTIYLNQLTIITTQVDSTDSPKSAHTTLPSPSTSPPTVNASATGSISPKPTGSTNTDDGSDAQLNNSHSSSSSALQNYGNRYPFEIRTTQKIYSFCAKSELLMREWCTVLEDCKISISQSGLNLMGFSSHNSSSSSQISASSPRQEDFKEIFGGSDNKHPTVQGMFDSKDGNGSVGRSSSNSSKKEKDDFKLDFRDIKGAKSKGEVVTSDNESTKSEKHYSEGEGKIKKKNKHKLAVSPTQGKPKKKGSGKKRSSLSTTSSNTVPGGGGSSSDVDHHHSNDTRNKTKKHKKSNSNTGLNNTNNSITSSGTNYESSGKESNSKKRRSVGALPVSEVAAMNSINNYDRSQNSPHTPSSAGTGRRGDENGPNESFIKKQTKPKQRRKEEEVLGHSGSNSSYGGTPNGTPTNHLNLIVVNNNTTGSPGQTGGGEEMIRWLKEMKLPSNYYHLFTNDGFDDLGTIKLMTDDDLLNVGISKTGHRKRILYWIKQQQQQFSGPLDSPHDSHISNSSNNNGNNNNGNNNNHNGGILVAPNPKRLSQGIMVVGSKRRNKRNSVYLEESGNKDLNKDGGAKSVTFSDTEEDQQVNNITHTYNPNLGSTYDYNSEEVEQEDSEDDQDDEHWAVKVPECDPIPDGPHIPSATGSSSKKGGSVVDERESYDGSKKDLSNVPDEVWTMKNLRVLWLFQNKLEVVPEYIGRLTKLRAIGLNENMIRELPNQIGYLEGLQVLDLRYNKLVKLPATIGRLSMLSRLFLRFNKLESLPDTIGLLTNLEMLSVRNNELVTLCRGVNHLKSLKILDVSNNHLSKLRSIAQLQQLKELDCKQNQLSELPFGWKLQNLTRLDLSNNQFVNFPSQICEIPNLQMLDMEANGLTNISNEIGRLSQLEKIWLNRNKIKSLPSEIGNLVHLKELHTKGNRIAAVPNQLRLLTSLKHLDLSTNKFVSFPASLPPGLTSLDVSDNEIKDIKPEDLLSWKGAGNVRELNLEENQLTGLPAEIGMLLGLAKFRLGYNMLETIPEEIGNLTLLKQVHLEHNKITMLPGGVRTLVGLELFVLTDNLLDDLPNEMVNMTSLSELKVDGNPFGNFPSQLRDAGGRDTYNYIMKREAKQRMQKKPKK